MPVSGGAGRSVSSTRAPVCRPTPVVRDRVLSVRCWSIGEDSVAAARNVSSHVTTRARAEAAPSHDCGCPLAPHVSPKRRRDRPAGGPHRTPSVRLLAQERRDVGGVERGRRDGSPAGGRAATTAGWSSLS